MKRFAMITGAPAIGPMSAIERIKGRYMRGPDGHDDGTVKALLERHVQVVEKKFGDLGIDDIKARLEHMEAAATRPRGGGGIETKSYGAQVAESEQFKALQSGNYVGRARIELKAITSAGGSGGGMISPGQDREIAGMARRSTRVRDLLTVIPTSSGSVDYPKQTTRTNAAAPVAEGVAKPYSNYGWTKVNVPMRTIAHLAKLTRQAMDDADQLAGEVDAELRYGLGLQEDAQILFGDNTGENLYGMMPQATAYALPEGVTMPDDPNMFDKLVAALLQQALTEYPPDGIVLHPTDWFQMRLLKDAAGGYLFGDPSKPMPPMLLGLPIALTQAMTVNNFLVGAFKPQKLYERLAIEVLISTENADDFEKNLCSLRAEERVALATRQPGALVKGSFA